MEHRKGMIMFFIIGLLTGFIVGYAMGAAQAASFCVEAAYKFLHINGYEINKGLIEKGLMYAGNSGSALFR